MRRIHYPHKRKVSTPKQLKRKLHISTGQIWTWQMTGSTVLIQSPTGQRTVIDHAKLTGASWYELERAKWKGYLNQYAVTPSLISVYIKDNLLQK